MFDRGTRRRYVTSPIYIYGAEARVSWSTSADFGRVCPTPHRSNERIRANRLSNMAGIDGTSNVPSKRLRKGTHSCIQCRQRKVRCRFEPGKNLEKCVACSERDDDCIPQQGKRHISRSQTRPESDVQATNGGSSSASTLDGSRSIRVLSHPQSRLTPGDPLSPPYKKIRITKASNSVPLPEGAPLFGLFQPSTPLNHRSLHSESNALAEAGYDVLRDIKLYVPALSELKEILSSSWQYTWQLWLHAFPTRLKPELQQAPDEQIDGLCALVYTAVHSDDCALVAKVVLCLMLQIQQLPLGSRQTDPVLQQKCMDSADALLNADRGLAQSLDGIECLLLQVEYHVCLGALKQVWLLVRRATTLAQMLGLHQLRQDVDIASLPRRQQVWCQLWQLDRGFSMIMGLPCITLDSQYPRIGPGMDEERFLYHLGTVMGQIVARNQSREDMAYNDTLDIDRALENCKQLMRPSWWRTERPANSSPNEVFREYSAKIRFHTTRKLLHLPFLLEAYKDGRYERSRLACLQASQALIECYRVLRDETLPAIKMCDMADFEAFCAAMTIVVDLTAQNSQLTAAETDWHTVLNVAEDLKRVSQTVHCVVAAKGAQVLQDLYEARHRSDESNRNLQLDIPYFGRIRMRQAPARPDASQALVIADNTSQAPHQTLMTCESTSEESGIFLDGWLFPFQDASPQWQHYDLTSPMVADFSDGSNWSWFMGTTEDV